MTDVNFRATGEDAQRRSRDRLRSSPAKTVDRLLHATREGTQRPEATPRRDVHDRNLRSFGPVGRPANQEAPVVDSLFGSRRECEHAHLGLRQESVVRPSLRLQRPACNIDAPARLKPGVVHVPRANVRALVPGHELDLNSISFLVALTPHEEPNVLWRKRVVQLPNTDEDRGDGRNHADRANHHRCILRIRVKWEGPVERCPPCRPGRRNQCQKGHKRRRTEPPMVGDEAGQPSQESPDKAEHGHHSFPRRSLA